MRKEKLLEELNIKEADRICNKNKEWGKIWLGGIFLPTYYPHQCNTVFVGLQPSENLLKNPHLRFLGNFNITKCDREFQKQLVKFGFGGSYVTDIVKLQRPAKEEPTEEEIKFFIPFLRKELEIISPKITIALGNKVYNILMDYKEKLGIRKLRKIYHPAYRFKKKEAWDNQFKELADKF